MKKLYRFVEDRKIAGVCAGLGDYFDLDPVFFRLFFLASLLFGGLGALAYLILWIMVPEKTGAQGEPRPLSGCIFRIPTARSGACAAVSENGSRSIPCSSGSRSSCSPSRAVSGFSSTSRCGSSSRAPRPCPWSAPSPVAGANERARLQFPNFERR